MGRVKDFSCVLRILVFLLSNWFVRLENVSQESWIVNTASGPIEGTTTKSFTGKDVHVFYGIPYAEPPIANLRFKAPQPVQPWNQVLKAVKKPIPCYQMYFPKVMGYIRRHENLIRRPWSEDCLKLNIWTPKPSIQDVAVIVLLHDGKFSFGSGSESNMEGSTLSAHSESIVVSLNYRLNAFGFLNLGEEWAPGNVGLLDQQLALKWVQENIVSFGGKKEAVILGSTGFTGSASVGYHLLSSGSKDLFKTAAFISGAPNCEMAFQDRESSIRNSKKLVSWLGCSKGNEEEVLSCLGDVHSEDIIDAQVAVLSEDEFLRPTVDGTFISESPLAALEAGHFKKTVYFLWSETHVGTLPLMVKNPTFGRHLEKGLSVDNYRKSLNELIPSGNKAIWSVIEGHYLSKCENHSATELREAAIQIYSDVLVNCCLKRFMNLLAKNGGQVYYIASSMTKMGEPGWIGSTYGAVGKYILGFPLAPELNGYSQFEAAQSSQFIEWIRYQSKRRASDVGGLLPLYTAENQTYCFWDSSGPHVMSHFKKEECHLWDHIIPQLLKVQPACKK